MNLADSGQARVAWRQFMLYWGSQQRKDPGHDHGPLDVKVNGPDCPLARRLRI